jgi:hypothetical protein
LDANADAAVSAGISGNGNGNGNGWGHDDTGPIFAVDEERGEGIK